MTDVELRLLRVFDSVVRNGGFAAAERELGVSRPAISRHMAELEARLGFRLCERGRGGFSL
ncbi:MAG: LysR family transcriptional regulator, partial [Pseudomonadota bacterium]